MSYEKQNFKDGQVLTAANMNHIEDGLSEVCGCFFSGLSDAINNANVHETLDGASVMRTINGDQITLTLLQDVEENGQVNFDTNVVLRLNGYTLSMSYAGENITVAAGASLYIDGTKDGSEVNVSNTATGSVVVLAMVHGALVVKGGNYSVTCTNSASLGFRSSESCPKMVLHDCTISTQCNTSNSIGVLSQGALVDFSSVTMTLNGAISTPVQYTGNVNMRNTEITATASAQCNGLLAYPNTKTTLVDVKLSAKSQSTNAYGINIQAGAELIARDLHLSVVTEAEISAKYGAYGISNEGICTIEDSFVLADAKSEKIGETLAVCINNSGTMICKNSEVAGTHSGLQNAGNLYVDRCLLSGVCHGGLYTLHSYDKEVVVNDTVLEGGVYRGQFADNYANLFGTDTDVGSNKALSAMYLGDQTSTVDGGDLYVDGCVFVGIANESFTVRPAAYSASGIESGKHPNRLFISRSKIAVQYANNPKGEIAPIRLNYTNEGALSAAFAEMYCGVGCNITVDNIMGGSACEEYLHSTEQLYRQKDNHLPTYNEYMVLMGQSGDNASLTEVSEALDGIIAMQEELIGS